MLAFFVGIKVLQWVSTSRRRKFPHTKMLCAQVAVQAECAIFSRMIVSGFTVKEKDEQNRKIIQA